MYDVRMMVEEGRGGQQQSESDSQIHDEFNSRVGIFIMRHTLSLSKHILHKQKKCQSFHSISSISTSPQKYTTPHAWNITTQY